jgi:1,4-alpha-glucan branching enzyme
LYKSEPALYEKQFSHEGFEWINHGDSENSVLSYIRKGVHTKDDLITICNFTPQVLDKYQVGLPKAGALELVFNSDEAQFGGSEVDFENICTAQQNPCNGKSFSAEFRLPPLGVLVYKYIN